MDIPTKYDPSKSEERWYDYWIKHDLFSSRPDDREPYTHFRTILLPLHEPMYHHLYCMAHLQRERTWQEGILCASSCAYQEPLRTAIDITTIAYIAHSPAPHLD